MRMKLGKSRTLSTQCVEAFRMILTTNINHFPKQHYPNNPFNVYEHSSPNYCSGDQIEKNEVGGACSTYVGDERRLQCSGGEPEGKRPLGRLRRGWEDNIKMYLQQVVCEGMDWIELAQDRDRWRALLNAVMNLRFP